MSSRPVSSGVAAIVPAAGAGRRLAKKTLKSFVKILGKPLLAHTLQALKKTFPYKEIIVAVKPSQLNRTLRIFRRYRLGRTRVVKGGRTRAESVANALRHVSEDCGWVLIHDAARPLVSAGLVRRLLAAAGKTGAAIATIPVTSTLKMLDPEGRVVLRTVDRRNFFLAQTPQVFRKERLVRRYKMLGERALLATDEASLFEGSSVRVRAVPGEAQNIKITTAEDLKLMRFYLRGR